MKAATSLRDQVINHIMQKIQHQDLTADETFTEQQLCDELNISRTPVREALLQLIANNAITRIPNKGYKIVELETKQKLDLYEVLANLDALAAKLAVPNMNQHDFLKMDELADKIDIAIKYQNYHDYYTLQDQFHDVYINRCDNEMLIKLMNTITQGPIHRSYISDDKEKLFKALRESNQEHRHITKLFRSGNTEELEGYLKNVHWQTKYEDMI